MNPLLFRLFRDNEVRVHELNYLFWECTTRCHFHCRHCGSDCSVQSREKDMPLADFLRALDTISETHRPKDFSVVLTGGEPLLRPDIAEAGREIRRRGFGWGMVTNGWFYDEPMQAKLLAAGMGALTVSLDGLEASHDWMRGMPGSYRRALRAIDLFAREPRLNADVVTCVNKRNLKELPEIYEILKGLGLKQWRLFTVFPAGRALNEPEMQLDKDEFRTLMEFIRSTRKEGLIKASYGCEGFLGNFEGEVRDQFFFCRAGISIGSVLADGSISACPSIRADYRQGNIYHDDFMEVWNTRFKVFRDRSWMKETEPCRSCRQFKYCRGGGMHLRDSEGRLLLCRINDCL